MERASEDDSFKKFEEEKENKGSKGNIRGHSGYGLNVSSANYYLYNF